MIKKKKLQKTAIAFLTALVMCSSTAVQSTVIKTDAISKLGKTTIDTGINTTADIVKDLLKVCLKDYLTQHTFAGNLIVNVCKNAVKFGGNSALTYFSDDSSKTPTADDISECIDVIQENLDKIIEDIDQLKIDVSDIGKKIDDNNYNDYALKINTKVSKLKQKLYDRQHFPDEVSDYDFYDLFYETFELLFPTEQILPYTDNAVQCKNIIQLYALLLSNNYDFNVQTFDLRKQYIDKIEAFYDAAFLIAISTDNTNIHNPCIKQCEKITHIITNERRKLNIEKENAETKVYCYRNKISYNRYLTPVNAFPTNYYLDLKNSDIDDFILNYKSYTPRVVSGRSTYPTEVKDYKYDKNADLLNREKCIKNDKDINQSNYDFSKSIYYYTLDKGYNSDKKNELDFLTDIILKYTSEKKSFKDVISEIFYIKNDDIKNINNYTGIYSDGEYKAYTYKHEFLDTHDSFWCWNWQSVAHRDYEIQRIVNTINWNGENQTYTEKRKFDHLVYNEGEIEKGEKNYPWKDTYTPSTLDKPLLIITKAE